MKSQPQNGQAFNSIPPTISIALPHSGHWAGPAEATSAGLKHMVVLLLSDAPHPQRISQQHIIHASGTPPAEQPKQLGLGGRPSKGAVLAAKRARQLQGTP
ncbi:hypothetical protein ADLECEL_10060 [Adlercreutzia equolifaciens subsp. celatus]|nr:hypothetical protein ADLECEL_10060 [Adlercreutzia equolifaciens subsp. celatus]